jgi:hypothetical protein
LYLILSLYYDGFRIASSICFFFTFIIVHITREHSESHEHE